MKTLLCLVALTALTMAAPADVNVSGKWTGTLNTTQPDGAANESSAFLVLKQEGTAITGSAGPNENEQHPIKKGTVAGDKITLEIEPRENQTIRVELVLAGDRLKGDVIMSRDGESRNGKLDLARAK
jgi:hypothetical protein